MTKACREEFSKVMCGRRRFPQAQARLPSRRRAERRDRRLASPSGCAPRPRPSPAASSSPPASASKTRLIAHHIFTERLDDRRGHARHRPPVPVDLQALAGNRGALRRPHPLLLSRTRRRVAAMVADQGINGFYHSKDARLACCDVRKVEPLNRALAGAAAWVDGLRADQSDQRSAVELASWDSERVAGQGRALVRLDARAGRRRVLRSSTCRSTRSTPRASCRSAASPAPAPSSRASPSAPAAGGGKPTAPRNAACMSTPTGSWCGSAA